MGRSALFVGVVFVLVFVAGTSQSDVSLETTSPVDAAAIPSGAPEPTLQNAVTNAPGDETIQKDPFQPFSAEGGIPYAELPEDEKQLIDRNRDVTGWAQRHDAFATGVREQSKRARAEVAQHQLGIGSLDTIGVVP
jgi:hypothetical protein